MGCDVTASPRRVTHRGQRLLRKWATVLVVALSFPGIVWSVVEWNLAYLAISLGFALGSGAVTWLFVPVGWVELDGRWVTVDDGLFSMTRSVDLSRAIRLERPKGVFSVPPWPRIVHDNGSVGLMSFGMVDDIVGGRDDAVEGLLTEIEETIRVEGQP